MTVFMDEAWYKYHIRSIITPYTMDRISTTKGITIPVDASAGMSLLHRMLLWCGVGSSVLYVAMNVFIPLQFEGYRYADHTVSELSAIGAPTRTVWVLFAIVYVLLFSAFGLGVLRSAGGNKRLRILGFVILAYCAVNLYWPPMHPRGSETSLTDTLHLVWAGIAVVFMMAMMGLGASIFDRAFRFYTLATMVLLFFFGMLTSLQAPNIPTNQPTPWLGVWERVMILFFLLWVSALSFILLRRKWIGGGS